MKRLFSVEKHRLLSRVTVGGQLSRVAVFKFREQLYFT